MNRAVVWVAPADSMPERSPGMRPPPPSVGRHMPARLGLLERFRETLKAEKVYGDLYATPRDARLKELR